MISVGKDCTFKREYIVSNVYFFVLYYMLLLLCGVCHLRHQKLVLYVLLKRDVVLCIFLRNIICAGGQVIDRIIVFVLI